MKKYTLYKIARPVLKIFMKIFYKIEIINNSNIPYKGKCILAGNHTSNLDPLLLMSSTKRTIRFLAKKELHKGILGPLFMSAGTIPVDRKNKSEFAKKEALKALNNEELICIFPEGTINRTNDIIMPFKYGVVSLGSKTSAHIVPFVITGKYKLFRKSVKIKFLNAYKIETNNLELENKKLMKLIKEELEKNI